MKEKDTEHPEPQEDARSHGWRTWVLVALILVAALTEAVFFFGYGPQVKAAPLLLLQGLSEGTSTSLQYGAWPALSNAGFYQKTETTLVGAKTSFIDADLGAMRLTVYQDGTPTLVVPILAKGKPGSWWETPSGLYAIGSREQNHVSTIGGVNMPWSLDFDGNFFIHGWPTYPDGTPVSTSYSGGCIRLSTDDAARVYALAAVGMPVLVHEMATSSAPFDYRYSVPGLSAKEYLVADIDTGAVLASSGADTQVPIASITKLMTALVTTEYVNLEKTLTVPSEAVVPTSKPRLYAGEKVSAYDLMFPLLEESSNQAAETFAASEGRAYFIRLMNAKAAAINLSSTSFTDPSGADSGDVSTAHDLFTLLTYLKNNRGFILNVTDGKAPQGVYSGETPFAGLENFNIVPGVSAPFRGGKIGKTTAAAETYAGLFTIPISGSPREIAIIVLGSSDAYADVAHLASFVENLYAEAPSAPPAAASSTLPLPGSFE